MIVKKDRAYFLDQDNDCHWYLVEAARVTDWHRWLALDSDDEDAWTPPDFAQALGTHPNQVVFINPSVSQ